VERPAPAPGRYVVTCAEVSVKPAFRDDSPRNHARTQVGRWRPGKEPLPSGMRRRVRYQGLGARRPDDRQRSEIPRVHFFFLLRQFGFRILGLASGGPQATGVN